MGTEKTETTIPKDFLTIFREAVIAFRPPAPMDREATRVFYETLQQFSIDVLRLSALRIRQRQEFFPTTGQWYQAAAEINREQLRAFAEARASSGSVVECARCGDTGSVYADCSGDATCGRPHSHAAHGFVCICSCRVTNQTYQKKQAAQALLARGGTE